MQHLEGDLEVCEDKLLLATQKLDKVIMSCLMNYKMMIKLVKDDRSLIVKVMNHDVML